jgi:hypothetical protein
MASRRLELIAFSLDSTLEITAVFSDENAKDLNGGVAIRVVAVMTGTTAAGRGGGGEETRCFLAMLQG